MNRKQKIIVSVTGIFLVMLILVGLTYAYFLTQIVGNTNNKSISVTTANLELVYGNDDGNIIGANETIKPNTTFRTKIFTVTNTGNATVEDYAVIIDNFAVKYHSGKKAGILTNLVNGEDGKPDMKLVIECKSYANYGKDNQTESGTCNGMDGYLPEKSDILLLNNIDEGITHAYSATLTYLEDGTDQSDDMNKTIVGKFNIIDTKNTINITGNVETYNLGDIVTINSEYKESVIYADGTYKFMGVKPDVHTIRVVGNTTTEVGKLSLKKGIEPNTTGTTTNNGTIIPEVTITEDSKTLTINLKGNLEINGIEGVETVNTNTLAYNILNNAKLNKNGTSYSPTPLTSPAEDISGENESTLSIAEDDYTASTENSSYYFRGNVEDNYVNFARMCWRIVKIQGDGTIKLVLEDQDELCSKSMNGNWNIPISNAVGASILGNFGFTTNGGSVLLNYLNGNSNSMVSAFKNFQTTKLSSYLGDLKEEEWCLRDKAYATKSADVTTPLTETEKQALRDSWESFYYESYVRLKGNNLKQPTFKCNGTKFDKFGDGAVMYVGSLTADEIVYAGAVVEGDSNYYYYLLNDYQVNNSLLWWTFSPRRFSDTIEEAFRVDKDGDLTGASLGANNSFRPSVTLESSVEIEVGGEGTLDKPYVIK